jgi:hypothetical protein
MQDSYRECIACWMNALSSAYHLKSSDSEYSILQRFIAICESLDVQVALKDEVQASLIALPGWLPGLKGIYCHRELHRARQILFRAYVLSLSPFWDVRTR